MLVVEQTLENAQCSERTQNIIRGALGQLLGEEFLDQAARRCVPVTLACLKGYQRVELWFSSFHDRISVNKKFCQHLNLGIIYLINENQEIYFVSNLFCYVCDKIICYLLVVFYDGFEILVAQGFNYFLQCCFWIIPAKFCLVTWFANLTSLKNFDEFFNL